jgi:hypothetical protein
MILIGTVFKDKDGKTKTGFSGRMGGRIVAPRLLKVNPVDFYGAGKQQKFHEGQFSWVSSVLLMWNLWYSNNFSTRHMLNYSPSQM